MGRDHGHRDRALALGADVVLDPADERFAEKVWAETGTGVTAVREQALTTRS